MSPLQSPFAPWSARVVVLTLVAALVALTGSPGANASWGSSPAGASKEPEATFGVKPATANDLDGRTYFSWGATPGAVLKDELAVVNYGDAPLPLTLYATDAINTDDGGFGLLPTKANARDVGSWISLVGVDGPVVVPASDASGPGTVVVPVDVTIPPDATPGDHAGGILAVLTSVGEPKDGAAVTLEQRVGARVFVQVAGELQPQLSVENLHAQYDGTLNPVGTGSVTVSFRLRNSGNVILGADAEVEVSGLLGSRQVDAPSQALLLPGSAVDYSVRVPDVPPTVWKTATVVVTPIATVTATADPPPAFSESVHFWAVPWSLLALVLLLVGAGAAEWWWHRRRRQSATGPTAPEVSAAAEEALS